jgi:hypothetical protein
LSGDGNTVAIGAISNDEDTTNAGHVRVYDWDGSDWTQRGSDIDGEALCDTSGYSVALSNDGNTVAIGAPYNNGAGHVRVFDWDGTSWTQRGVDIDGASGSYLGWSVSLSDDGNTVAISAIGVNTYSGRVRVYDWDGTAWTQRGQDLDAEGSEDGFGQSVSLSGDSNAIAIGASFNNGNGSDSGHVRVFDWDGTNWTQRGVDIDGEAGGDESGHSVSLSNNGNTVAIGAIKNDGTGLNTGQVRVYDWDGTNWTQRGSDINGDSCLGQEFGFSAALSEDGDTLVASAHYWGEGSGIVRVFDWDGTNWTQRYNAIEGAICVGYREIGMSVSLSNDGNVVAIGGKDPTDAGLLPQNG